MEHSHEQEAGRDSAAEHVSEAERVSETERNDAAVQAVLTNPKVMLVRAALAEHGYTDHIRVFSEATRTAAQAAEACGCSIGAIANSLVFRCDNEPLLILTSGAHRVDVRYVQHQLGSGKLHRADAEFVLEQTGQVIGGVAPLGHSRAIRTILDTSLAQFPEIWAAAGHPNTVFRTSYADLLAYTGAMEMPVAP